MSKVVKTLWREEDGENLSEYILLAVLVSLVVITVVIGF